jgi:hypothetical protein
MLHVDDEQRRTAGIAREGARSGLDRHARHHDLPSINSAAATRPAATPNAPA